MMKRSLFYLLLILLLSACGNNKLTEKVVSTFDNGQPAKVYYYNQDNQLVAGKEYYENGFIKMEGSFANDVREGDWIAYFPDGKVRSTGTYKDGLRIGKAQVYYENGNLWMDGYYTDDHKCGEWVFYDEQGYETGRVNYGSCD